MLFAEYKNNFYIGLAENKTSSLEDHNSINNNYLYSFGYLRKYNKIYLGGSLDFFSKNSINHFIISENDKQIYMFKESKIRFSLKTKYNFFEFENLKLFLGIDLGYQINNIKLNYMAYNEDTVKENYKKELDVGTIIDKNLINSCNVGITGVIEGTNIVYNSGTQSYEVVGSGVYCNSYLYVVKQMEYPKDTLLMKTSFPISFNFLILYELYPNIDVGLALALTIIENINLNYKDKFINLKTQQSLSDYRIQVIMNFKI